MRCWGFGCEWATSKRARLAITSAGATITPFTRNSVSYVEVAFSASGTFSLSQSVSWHNRALGAGGGTGGACGSSSYVPGGGGAGGLIQVTDAPMAAGAYSVTIGAGGAAIPAQSGGGGLGYSGSNSVLVTPSGTVTAIGGGFGASQGTGFTVGTLGGSGGGGRGPTSGTATAGAGTAGQGYAGGAGFVSTDANLRASGGGGGAGGAGGAAASGAIGAGGAGVLIGWGSVPRTVCAGGAGLLATTTGASGDASFGSGSRGAVAAAVGKGGDGFLFLVFRADQVSVALA